MSGKIIILNGSPRERGNTRQVCDWVAEAARAAGAEVEIVDTAFLKYDANGCTACMKCQASEEYRCVIEDDASDILARIPDYDVLVLASPIYFMGFTAQLKLILDRMLSLVKMDPETGSSKSPLKKMDWAFIGTAGGGDDGGLGLTEQTAQAAAEFFGRECRSLKVPFAPMDPTEMATKTEVRDQAADFGRQLAGK
jgi:multimeric flavodoxin WrbA